MEIVNVKLKNAPVKFIDGDRSAKYPKREEFTNEGIIFLNANSIANGRFNISNVNYITQEKFESITKGRVIADDLILTTRGNGVGDVSFYSGEFGDALINAQMLIIRTNSNELYSRYLYYLLSSTQFKTIFRNHATGSAQPQLPISTIKEIEISYPKDVLKQQKIASILSTYDDLIENNLRRIKLLEEAAQNIYREWFVHFRFPGYEDTEFVDGLPKGWEKRRVDDLFDITIGKTPPRAESQWFNSIGDGIKWISIRDIQNSNLFIFQTSEQIVPEGVVKFNMNIAEPNTVILSFKLTVGKVAITTERMVTNEAIAHFNKNSHAISEIYLYLYLMTFDYNSLGSTSSIGVALNSKIVKSIPIIKPGNTILGLFEMKTVSIFQQIKNLQLQNITLKEARGILLPRLMNQTIEV